ncbi:unnamed protein product [Sphagnum balticum]
MMAKGPRSLHSPLSVDSEEEEELSVYEAIVATATTADEVADAIAVASMDVGVAVSSRDKTEGSKPGGGNICSSFCLVAVFSLPLFLRSRARRLERWIFYLPIIRKNWVVASSGRCLVMFLNQGMVRNEAWALGIGHLTGVKCGGLGGESGFSV